MRTRPDLRELAGTLLLALLIGACGAPPASPTATLAPTLTPSPAWTATLEPTPTLTPTLGPVPVTDVNFLIGTWEPTAQTSDAMYLKLNADGTFAQAFVLSRLNSEPNAEGNYTLVDSLLSMIEKKISGVPPCSMKTGIYKVMLLPDGRIELIRHKDNCKGRINSTEGRYKRIP